MRRLDCLSFRVPDAQACAAFYQDVLGMSSLPRIKNKDNDGAFTVGYDPNGMKLSFHDEDSSCAVPRQSSPKDAYWKIGIVVKNLDHAVAFFHDQNGVAVSKPAQFLDIGYLCHLTDPAGLTIELLQQGFEGDEQEIDQNQHHPIGGQATLAHITFRATTNFGHIQNWCQETMNMRLLSIQPVPSFGFTLYFYTWTENDDETSSMPKPKDLTAVENRPWLWARPYGLFEIQHRENNTTSISKSDNPLRQTGPNEAGPTFLRIVDDDEEEEGKTIITIDCNKDLGL